MTSPATAVCTDTNTCLGVDALPSNAGQANTAIGYRTLFTNIEDLNTAVGFQVLSNNTTGIFNTGLGANALRDNTSGSGNIAVGREALSENIEGGGNTAVGLQALQHSNTFDNTAVGTFALRENILGIENTAIGMNALSRNTLGFYNTAIGKEALLFNIDGAQNTAIGRLALGSLTYANDNTAVGANSLMLSKTANRNTAVGLDAQRENRSGSSNTSIGVDSLRNSRSGVRNVALGYQAGIGIEGSDNIVIGARTQGGVADNGVIRIGSNTLQKKAFVAGIRGVQIDPSTATAVFIGANGQLGTITSSREVKEDVQPMGSVSERLMSLRPVTFRYKEHEEDGSQPVQFGLIAEEVADLFPELVVRNEKGQPETVAYHLLPSLLLNQLQKEHELNQQQAEQLAAQATQLAEVSEL